MIWSFWVAAALAAFGAVLPFAVSGFSARMTGMVVPFAVAAIALGACATLHPHGRPLTVGLYFVAGLAAVYGLLAIFAVPLRLAVIGTCAPAPAPCALGLERPLTSGENTGMAIGVAAGLLAIFVGFFGLVTLFRSLAPHPSPPPERRIPAVPPAAATHVDSTAERAAADTAPATGEAAPPPPARAEEPELPAPTDEPELPSPVENLELPAAEPEPELPAHVETPEGGDSPTPPEGAA